jgi:hypothetical protein
LICKVIKSLQVVECLVSLVSLEKGKEILYDHFSEGRVERNLVLSGLLNGDVSIFVKPDSSNKLFCVPLPFPCNLFFTFPP